MYFQLVLSLDFLELLIQILFNQAQMIIRCLFMHIFVVARIGQVIFFKVCDLGLKFFVSFLLSSQQLVNPLDFLWIKCKSSLVLFEGSLSLLLVKWFQKAGLIFTN